MESESDGHELPPECKVLWAVGSELVLARKSRLLVSGERLVDWVPIFFDHFVQVFCDFNLFMKYILYIGQWIALNIFFMDKRIHLLSTVLCVDEYQLEI